MSNAPTTSTGSTVRDLPRALVQHPVIAIVRGDQDAWLDPACDTLVETGMRHLELTTTTPGWQDAVRRLAGVRDVTVGVGTVLKPDQARLAHDLGASFVVAPDTDPAIGETALGLGLDWYPGALTPTEILRAWRLGATAVKVFPWRALGGLTYLRELRGPLPDVPLLPTGGVSLDDVGPLLTGGAVGVGMGSPLLGTALADGDMTALAARCRAVLTEVTRAGYGGPPAHQDVEAGTAEETG